MQMRYSHCPGPALVRVRACLFHLPAVRRGAEDGETAVCCTLTDCSEDQTPPLPPTHPKLTPGRGGAKPSNAPTGRARALQ